MLVAVVTVTAAMDKNNDRWQSRGNISIIYLGPTFCFASAKWHMEVMITDKFTDEEAETEQVQVILSRLHSWLDA